MNKTVAEEQTQKAGLSCVVTGLVGCGVVAMLLLVLGGVGVYFGVRVFSQEMNDFVEPFEQKGYRRVTAQVHVEEKAVEESTVYVLQVLRLEDGANADIAIMAQVAEIHGTVDGDIDFFGQVLEIKPGAVVKGNIRAKGAQVIKVSGTVEGKVTGIYQRLDTSGGKVLNAIDESAGDNESSESADAAAGNEPETGSEVETGASK